MGLEVETLEKMLKVYSPLGTCTTDFLLVVLVQIPKGIFFLRQFMLHLLLSDLQDFQQLLVPLQLLTFESFLPLLEFSSKSFVSLSKLLSLLIILLLEGCCKPGKIRNF